MRGEQWICRCGTHNLFLREKCRECGEERKTAKVGEESCFEVMDRVYNESALGKKVSGAKNQRKRVKR